MYDSYAPIYRLINQGAWSERMARWTIGWLRERGVTHGRVIDWGCGDGAAGVVFAQAGWAVTGIDRSERMIQLARARDSRIDWRGGDLTQGADVAPGTLATAFYDTLNYLPSIVALRAGWRTLAASVTHGGYIVADVNTPYEYASGWNDRYVITADTDDALVLNRLRYDPAPQLAQGRIIWFAREGHSDVWQRGEETHTQRAHTDEEMVAAIAAAGLRLIARLTPQGKPPTLTATRLIYIARKG